MKWTFQGFLNVIFKQPKQYFTNDTKQRCMYGKVHFKRLIVSLGTILYITSASNSRQIQLSANSVKRKVGKNLVNVLVERLWLETNRKTNTEVCHMVRNMTPDESKYNSTT